MLVSYCSMALRFLLYEHAYPAGLDFELQVYNSQKQNRQFLNHCSGAPGMLQAKVLLLAPRAYLEVFVFF